MANEIIGLINKTTGVAIADADARYVPNTRQVNGHALTSDVTVTKSDLGLSSVENTALSTWAGSGNITTVGTLSSGTVPWSLLSNLPGLVAGVKGLVTLPASASGKILDDSGNWVTAPIGNVTGPSASTDNAIVRFDGLLGRTIQDYTSNAPTISDYGMVTISGGISSIRGSDSIFNEVFGAGAGALLTSSSSSNTLVGFGALAKATSGKYNVALGAASLAVSTEGDDNVAVGFSSISVLTTGYDNVTIGSRTLNNATSGSGNVIIGKSAASNATDSNNSIFIGYKAGIDITSGVSGVLLIDGYSRPSLSAPTKFSPTASIIYGQMAEDPADQTLNLNAVVTVQYGLTSPIIGGTYHNEIIGYEAGAALTTGYNNSVLGYQALQTNTEGWGNSAFGMQALGSLTTGSQNVGIGYGTLGLSIAGEMNTAIGNATLAYDVTGSQNTAIGTYAGLFWANGNNNVIVGSQALVSAQPNTGGNYNVVVGAMAGLNLLSSSNSIIIGYNAGSDLTSAANLLVVDDRDRFNLDPAQTSIASAILYGVMADDPADQTLKTNAAFTATYGMNIPTGQTYKINGVALAKGDVGLGNVTNDSQVKRGEMGAPLGVATLGADTKLTASQLPDIAVSEFLGTVASEVLMLALVGQKGDWCIRSDLGTTWIITGADPTQLSSWTQMAYPAAPVISVNSKTGAVSLSYSDVGAEPSGAVSAHAGLTGSSVHGLGTISTYASTDYVTVNTAITGATKTKITYDSKGLVTSGANATTADISDSSNRRYVTDSELLVLGNTSGVNTGDETTSTIKTKLGAASASADGYLTSSDWSTFNSKLADAPSDGKQYGRKNATWSEIASGSYLESSIPAPSHTFVSGDLWKPVTIALTLAQADTEEHAETLGLLSAIVDADTIKIVQSGVVTRTAHGLTVGDVYFLSDTTAGSLVRYVNRPTASHSFLKPMLRVVDINTVEVMDYPAIEVGVDSNHVDDPPTGNVSPGSQGQWTYSNNVFYWCYADGLWTWWPVPAREERGTASAVFTSEDNLVSVLVSDVHASASDIVVCSMTGEEAAILGMTVTVGSIVEGVGFYLYFGAPNGASGTYTANYIVKGS